MGIHVTFNLKNLSKHVRTLASDEFEGRESTSPGERKTIDYLATQFAQLGLQPAGERGGWTQAVRLRKIEMSQPPVLRLSIGASTVVLHHREEAVLTSLLGKDKIAIEGAPIVFVGYGVSARELGWDDFKSVDLKDKVAIFLINDPDFEAPIPGRFGGKAMTYYGRWTYKFEEAARRGAAAALIVHEDAPASYGWTTVQNSWGGTQFDIERADAAAAHTPIRGWLRRNVTEALFQRAHLDFNASKLRAMQPDFRPVELTGMKLSVEAHLSVAPAVTHNVIARLPGRERPQESVIYSAHWDHLGIGKPDHTGDRIHHGAIDNATAVAGLLELARVFVDAPRTARSIDFVAFAAEEKGLLGSQSYVRHPSTALENIAAVFNMELMGIGGATRDLSIWGNARSTLQDALYAAAAAQGRSVTPDWQLEAGYLYRSDHFPFAKEGVPAITVSSGQDLHEGGVAAGRKAYSDYITHQYHQPADRWSPQLDLRGLALDLEVLYRAGRDIAESAEWPQWSEGGEFTNRRRTQKRTTRLANLACCTIFCSIAGAGAVMPAVSAAAESGTRHVRAFDLPVSSYVSPEARQIQQRPEEQDSGPQCPSLSDPASLTIEGAKTVRDCWVEKEKPRLERMRAQFKVVVETGQISGVPTETFVPKEGVSGDNKNRVLINLHGGGFIVGTPGKESIPIAGIGKIKVVGIHYRMGPENKFPAASVDVTTVYKTLLQKYAPENIGIYGCSAGGRLTAQAMAWFQKVGLPKPAAVGMFGSGAAGGVDGDSAYIGSALIGTDARNFPFRQAYFGSHPNLQDPLLAPLSSLDVMARFPPALLISATRDYGLSNIIHTHATLVKLGVPADLHVWDGLGHCFFQDPALPESREVYDVIVRFFDSHLGKAARGPPHEEARVLMQ